MTRSNGRASHRLTAVLAAAALFVGFGEVRAADTVVFGHGLSTKFLDGLDSPCPRPPAAELQEICTGVWFVWEVAVSRTIAGPPVKRRLRAAIVQHGTYSGSILRANRLFLLRPVEDTEKRALLEADYRIVDMSSDNCFYTEPVGLEAEAAKVQVVHANGVDRYCFDLKTR